MRWDDEELLLVFRAEARENLAAIEEGLLLLELQPNDAATIDALFRAAHTLKGGAATLSLETLSDIAHHVEDLLHAIRDGEALVAPRTISVLLQSVDLLRSLLPEHFGQDPQLTVAQRSICDELQRLIDGGEATAHNEVVDDAAQHAFGGRALRVSIQRLDRLLDLTAEINVSRGIVRRRVMSLPREVRGEISEEQRRLDDMFRELQELIMRTRMLPLAGLFRQYARTVRDAAQSSGKKAQLTVEGGDVELDARITELVRDPLLHLVRNAIGHGIETPVERERLGKPPSGTIRLQARRDGPALVIEISDDGRGFDRERILARARQLGLAGADASLSDEATFALVFAPGFSTAEQVTGLSGRGVGMDVVKRNIVALRGSIVISSRKGQGSTISVRLPLTVAVVPVMPMACGEELFALPLDSIVECLDLPAGGSGGIVDVHGESVPSFPVAELFDFPPSTSNRHCLVVVAHSRGKAGLIVDRLFDTVPAVIKPLGKLFAAFPFIAGSTVLNTGKVALILDAEGIVRTMTRQKEIRA